MYWRIVVCFPIYEESQKKEITDILKMYLDDNISAASLEGAMNNIPIEFRGE